MTEPDLKVSVIIPCYNAAKYISETLRSVLNQTMQNFEIIIVDDGSTDESAVIVKSFKDPRIHYVYQINRGHAATRNTAIRKAKGKFIAFLDSDDVWHASKLEKQLQLTTSYDAVYCGYRNISEDGGSSDQKKTKHIHTENLKDAILSGNVISGSLSSVLIRKDVIENAGYLREDILIGEDWEYWFRILWGNYTFGFVDEELVSVRVRNGSVQNSAAKKVKLESLRTVFHCFLNHRGLTDAQRALVYLSLARNEYYNDGELRRYRNYYVAAVRSDIRSLFKLRYIWLMIKSVIKVILWKRQQ